MLFSQTIAEGHPHVLGLRDTQTVEVCLLRACLSTKYSVVVLNSISTLLEFSRTASRRAASASGRERRDRHRTRILRAQLRARMGRPRQVRAYTFTYICSVQYGLTLSLHTISLIDTSATRFWTPAPPNSSRIVCITHTPHSDLRPKLSLSPGPPLRRPPVRARRRPAAQTRLRQPVRSRSLSAYSTTPHSTRCTSRRPHSAHRLHVRIRAHVLPVYHMNSKCTCIILLDYCM